jgi:hypothetical protein
VVTVEEEIARKKAEEVLKKEAEARQKRIDVSASKVCAVVVLEYLKKSHLSVETYLNLTVNIL